MMLTRRLTVFLVVVLLAPPSFAATWYEDYEQGIKAARARNWPTVIAKMNSAIRQKPNEGAREKTYGVIFIAYYPYYYRGMALYETGQFQQAIADLERTRGVGAYAPEDKETLLRKAKERLEDARPVRQTPTPAPPTPTPGPIVTPTPRPSIVPPPTPTPRRFPPDESTREMEQRARAVIDQANRAGASARAQQADSLARSEYTTAARYYAQTLQLAAGASTPAHWRRVMDTAESAKAQFDLASATARRAVVPVDPTDVILSDLRRRLRLALDNYFSGRFGQASTQFAQLSQSQPDNALIWAFLGASRYSEYYIEGASNPQARVRAEEAFRRAKRKYQKLPANYFSPRIRRFYESVR